MTVEEYESHAPEKLELIRGDIPEAEKFLLLVLTNLGLHRAAMLVGLEEWTNAVQSDEPELER